MYSKPNKLINFIKTVSFWLNKKNKQKKVIGSYYLFKLVTIVKAAVLHPHTKHVLIYPAETKDEDESINLYLTWRMFFMRKG